MLHEFSYYWDNQTIVTFDISAWNDHPKKKTLYSSFNYYRFTGKQFIGKKNMNFGHGGQIQNSNEEEEEEEDVCVWIKPNLGPWQ